MNTQALSISEFNSLLENSVLLDSRPATAFTRGFIPGSISLGLEGHFEEWARTLVPHDQPLLWIAEPGREEETFHRLQKAGFKLLQGWLEGGFESWTGAGGEIDMIIDVEADELAMDLPYDKNMVVVDVRHDTEFAEGHLLNAFHLPLEEMSDPATMALFEEHQNIYIHCVLGYRSVIAASLLKRQGIHNLRNVLGGFNSILLQENRFQIVKEGRVLN